MVQCYHEILSTVRFHEDIPAREVQSALAEIINNSMIYDEQLKDFHHRNTFKFYVFSAPYPLEADRIYRKGRIYCFHLRTLDLKFALKVKQYLPKAKGLAKVISSELKNYKLKTIEELVTLTPIVCTIDNRCWMPENGIGLLSERLHVNILKKSKTWDASLSVPEEFFFNHITMLNQKPIVMSYRGKRAILLGHKIRLRVKPNPWAQQLAFTALAVGLLEKNGLGFGYCIARR
ncbi:hypothetical protein Dtox_3006 [Desulfofarcimen acetoxidans DSM 771]|uniref:CRISPR-associated protein Cas6 n=1 Tax=Desulfofarcimen acetoxidans (strain ATCC 49208 / DSM 771 / KCTC 5769 / VKM B-1644 / 5575) TaxID=485916 RepID=C8W3H3_DESAS|nr:CRISPR-associated endoribonuclease Cas6 [Desulfofarcimen acetoxidans]ACV63759.1 hypothetical protein Dtox_3006 [Desulfofarcimen acetoxidans DSM 771]